MKSPRPPRSRGPGVVFAGIAPTRAFIDEHYGGSVNAFAVQNNLSQSELSRFLNGKKQRFSLGFATRLSEATRGLVKVSMLQPPEPERT